MAACLVDPHWYLVQIPVACRRSPQQDICSINTRQSYVFLQLVGQGTSFMAARLETWAWTLKCSGMPTTSIRETGSRGVA